MDKTFSQILPDIPLRALTNKSREASVAEVDAILKRGVVRTLEEFAVLISPAADARIEQMARISQQLTLKHFGKTIRLFAPIYLSNECVNVCKYCGFSRNNDIPRITIPVSQMLRETEMLAEQGFRSLLIVAGEHPKYVSNGYVEECIRTVLPIMPSLSIELGPMSTEGYIPLVEAGCEGLVVYQESYHEPTYKELHTAGPKKHFNWRMDTPERAYDAGFRRLSIAALFGLYDWRYEAIATAAHAHYLQRRCWKAQISVGFPRMRPATGGFSPEAFNCMGDRDLVKSMCAMRMFLPHAGMTISTRESPALRDGLVPIGTTMMSAGSSTEPGGYSSYDVKDWKPKNYQPGEQFHISDERSPREVAQAIRAKGYEPVWKDFDQSLVSESFSRETVSV